MLHLNKEETVKATEFITKLINNFQLTIMKNKKITLKLRLMLLLLCCGMTVLAQQVEVQVPAISGLEAALKANHSDDAIALITDLKVTTPDKVFIGPDDFTFLKGIPKLTNLDLSGASVTTANNRTDNSFPRDVFNGNQTLKTIVFPNTLTGLSRGLFSNSALEGVVTLPKGVKNVTEYEMTFGGSVNITGFAVEDGNPYLKAVDGVLYTADQKTLIVYPYGKTGTTFSVPEGVTALGTSAFGWNGSLEEITLSSTIATLPRQDKIINNSTKVRAIYVADGNATYGSTNGFLVDKTTGTLMAFPPANTDETIIIDGSIVKIVPSGYFSMAVANLKNIIFTEGVEEISGLAFKIGADVVSKLEYMELPSTIKKIGGEAVVGNANLLQVVCKATTPPTLAGQQIFRGSNGKDVRCAVPAEALDAYKNSVWNSTIKGNEGINAFPGEQIVAYHTVAMVGGSCVQSVSAPNFSINVKAGTAPDGEDFSKWTSTPNVTFANAKVPATSFVMLDEDVTITAFFSPKRPYTITNAVTGSGVAAVGGIVNIEAYPTQGTKIFHRWEIVKGEDLVIDNPNAVATSFMMVDGEVTIDAVYKDAYLIDIFDGSAPFDAFEGETITIVADKKAGKDFEKWTTTTSGVTFANATQATTTFVMPTSEVSITAVFTDAPVAMTEITEEGEALVLYPNPATDYIRLTNTKSVTYKIYNVVGTMVLNGVTNGEQISVSGLAKGIYLFEANGRVVRFIKR